MKLTNKSHFANDLGLDSLDTVEVVMAIEEVRVLPSNLWLLWLTHMYRSSALRSLTKRRTQSTAVGSLENDDIRFFFLTFLAVDKAVEYILSQPDGASTRIGPMTNNC